MSHKNMLHTFYVHGIYEPHLTASRRRRRFTRTCEPHRANRMIKIETKKERGRGITPSQPHKADAGAARTSPGRSLKREQMNRKREEIDR